MPISRHIATQLAKLRRPFDTYNQIELSRNALLHNFDLLAKLSGNQVIPVLKANAYGHGIEPIVKILERRKFPYLAVDGYFEALKVQAISARPVLVMGAIKPANFAKMSFDNVAFVVNDRATIKALGRTGQGVKVHLELETGMHRHGIEPSDLDGVLDLISGYPNIELEGVMSHLADADNPDSSYTLMQVTAFDTAVERILAADFRPAWVHLAQSAGSAKVESAYANAIRPGLALYGINPLAPDDPSFEKLTGLEPVLSLKSAIARVLQVRSGETVGYGCSYTAKRPSRIGVLPLGYFEGLPRALSNAGMVQWDNQYLPIVGRICMNHTMVDLTDSAAELGDKVTVISSDPASRNSVAAICAANDLFNYELLVHLADPLRRDIS